MLDILIFHTYTKKLDTIRTIIKTTIIFMVHSMETFKMMLNIHFKQKSVRDPLPVGYWSLSRLTNLAILSKWPVCIRQEVACEKKKVLIGFGLAVTLFTIFSSWKPPILPWRTHSLLSSYVISLNI